MGAEYFENRAQGKTAQDAFDAAVDEARHEYGHRGYTGTIAEKSGFKMVYPREGEDPMACVARCADDDDHFSQDKWADAACVVVAPGKYVFFGWASS